MRDRSRKKIMAGLIAAEILSQSIPCISMAAEYLPSVGAGLLKEQYYEKELKKTEKTAIQIAEVTADCLNVRKGQGTDTQIIGQLEQGAKKKIEEKPQNGWIPIEYYGGRAYISDDYVTIKEKYDTVESEEKKGTVEERGKRVVDYAKQFLGNPYVWGGTSLTEGADCSGFVQSVYRKFGVKLPRTTWDMENAGIEVTYDEILPGDLILYEGHVGIYIEENQIINAIDEENGIGISPAFFTDIITIRRVLE